MASQSQRSVNRRTKALRSSDRAFTTLKKAGDAAHFRTHAGRNDDGRAVAVGGGRPAEYHVLPVAERNFLIDRSRVLADRQALASERGFSRLQRRRFEKPRVSGNRVTLLDEHDVAGHEFGGRSAPPFHRRG